MDKFDPDIIAETLVFLLWLGSIVTIFVLAGWKLALAILIFVLLTAD